MCMNVCVCVKVRAWTLGRRKSDCVSYCVCFDKHSKSMEVSPYCKVENTFGKGYCLATLSTKCQLAKGCH